MARRSPRPAHRWARKGQARRPVRRGCSAASRRLARERLGRAHRPHRAVCTAVVDPREELRPLGGGRGLLHHARAIRRGCRRSARPAHVRSPRRRRSCRDTPGGRRPAVSPCGSSPSATASWYIASWAWRCASSLLTGALAGLDVDDHQPARVVAFQPVQPAAHPDARLLSPSRRPRRRPSISVPTSVSSWRVCARHCANVDSIARCRASSLSEYHSRIEWQFVPDLFEFVEHLALRLCRAPRPGRAAASRSRTARRGRRCRRGVRAASAAGNRSASAASTATA